MSTPAEDHLTAIRADVLALLRERLDGGMSYSEVLAGAMAAIYSLTCRCLMDAYRAGTLSQTVDALSDLYHMTTSELTTTMSVMIDAENSDKIHGTKSAAEIFRQLDRHTKGRPS